MDNQYSLWKSLLTTGNYAFRKEQWAQALYYYQRASRQAYENYSALKNDISEPGIASILVCHFNIADTHLRMKHIEQAVNQFTQCFQFLAPIVKNHPNDEICLRAYSHSRSEWLSFKSTADSMDEICDPPEIEQIEHRIVKPQTVH